MNLRQVDMNLLVAMDALLTECHVSRAAETLGLSQPALSRMLARMRSLFDDPLLVRGKGGLMPTERAQELMPRLRDILDQTQQILEKQTFNPALSDRQFRIRATPYSMQVYLPSLAIAFSNIAPSAALDIRVLDAHTLEDERPPETDLAIVSDLIHVPESYMHKKLGSDHFVCVMAASHPLANEPLTLEGYLKYRHIQVTMGGGPSTPVDDMLARLGRARTKALYLPDARSGMGMLAGTDLLMTQTSRLAVPAAAALGLVLKPLPFDLPDATYSLAWHPVHHHHEAHRWFRRFAYMEIRKLMADNGGSP